MAKCQGLTAKGKPCKLKAYKNGYCKPHQDQLVPDIVPEVPETPEVPFVPEVQPIVSTPVSRSKPKSYMPKSSIGKGVLRFPVAVEVQTTTLEPDNRVLRYRMNPRCPSCDTHPTVCMLRRKNYGLFKCRDCGHRFEIDRRTGE